VAKLFRNSLIYARCFKTPFVFFGSTRSAHCDPVKTFDSATSLAAVQFAERRFSPVTRITDWNGLRE
jgi:hypothetical protein